MEEVLDEVDVLNAGIRYVTFGSGQDSIADDELVLPELIPEDPVLNDRACCSWMMTSAATIS